MLRYLAIATVIVLGVLAILASFPHARHPAGDVRYSSSTATPGPAQNGDDLGATPLPMRGEAPWALSALPECFHQESRRDGTPAFARIGFPKRVALLPTGFRLKIADCALDVHADTIDVIRGDDRLTIPPHAHIFQAPGRRLILDRTAYGREEVRVYSIMQ